MSDRFFSNVGTLRKSVSLLLVACAASGCTTALSPDRDDVVLVRARLVLDTVVKEGPGWVETAQGITIYPDTHDIDFDVTRVLIGHTDQRKIRIRTLRTHSLRPDLDYYILETRDGAALKTQWWEVAYDGLCIYKENDAPNRFPIADEIAALEKTYPCTEEQGRPHAK